MQIAMTFSECPEAEHTVILQRVLGQGKFYVYQAKSATLGCDLALKVFSRNNGTNPNFLREKRILSKINHPNIISYVPILNHDLPHDIIATEYTPNGDLFDFVTKGGMVNDKLIRSFLHQVVDGVEYLHSRNIAHLDLKLENLLLDRNFILKILDFDQAQPTEDAQIYSGGTVGYRAPEIIERRCKNLKAVDMYSIGVILYVFKTGEMPFTEAKGDKIKRTAKYEMFAEEKERFWREKEMELRLKLGSDFKELVSSLWEEDVEKRLTIESLKRSRWYNGETYDKEELKEIVSSILEQIKMN